MLILEELGLLLLMSLLLLFKEATISNANHADAPLARRSSMTPQNVSHVPPARSSMIPQHVSHVPPACSREKWQLLQGKREVCAPACPTENPLGIQLGKKQREVC